MKDETNAHLGFPVEKRTDIHKKMILYLKRLTEDPVFMKKVFEMRKKYGIPKEGVEPIFEKNDKGVMREVVSFRSPPGFHDDLIKIANEYKIRDPFDTYLDDLVVHNDLDSEWYYGYREIVDLQDKLGLPESKVRMIYLEELREYAEQFPVAILLDPYMNQRDLLNFVKTTFKTYIEPLQLKYRDQSIKIGRIRNRSERVKKRDDFICKNSKKMGIKDLTLLVNKEFKENLDYTYVRKIIEKQRQKISVHI